MKYLILTLLASSFLLVSCGKTEEVTPSPAVQQATPETLGAEPQAQIQGLPETPQTAPAGDTTTSAVITGAPAPAVNPSAQ